MRPLGSVRAPVTGNVPEFCDAVWVTLISIVPLRSAGFVVAHEPTHVLMMSTVDATVSGPTPPAHPPRPEHDQTDHDHNLSDDTLTKVIAELRQALGDTPRAPRISETVHGRGFRLVAEVSGLGSETGPPTAATDAAPPTAASRRGEAAPAFVGRQPELARLDECLRLAAEGTRQLVFITGEAGIGKTTLVEEFLRSATLRDPDISILHGQCIQQHGQREPYMPVLDALERVLSSPLGATLIRELRRVAPCWYVQIPWLLSEGEPPGWEAAMMNGAPQRMLREIGTFLDSMAARSTVILVLEDLHWSDRATTDLLAFLAERRDPARLLIIGTYRPAEAITHEHPVREVKQALRSRGRAIALALPYSQPRAFTSTWNAASPTRPIASPPSFTSAPTATRCSSSPSSRSSSGAAR